MYVLVTMSAPGPEWIRPIARGGGAIFSSIYKITQQKRVTVKGLFRLLYARGNTEAMHTMQAKKDGGPIRSATLRLTKYSLMVQLHH